MFIPVQVIALWHRDVTGVIILLVVLPEKFDPGHGLEGSCYCDKYTARSGDFAHQELPSRFWIWHSVSADLIKANSKQKPNPALTSKYFPNNSWHWLKSVFPSRDVTNPDFQITDFKDSQTCLFIYNNINNNNNKI